MVLHNETWDLNDEIYRILLDLSRIGYDASPYVIPDYKKKMPQDKFYILESRMPIELPFGISIKRKKKKFATIEHRGENESGISIYKIETLQNDVKKGKDLACYLGKSTMAIFEVEETSRRNL